MLERLHDDKGHYTVSVLSLDLQLLCICDQVILQYQAATEWTALLTHQLEMDLERLQKIKK